MGNVPLLLAVVVCLGSAMGLSYICGYDRGRHYGLMDGLVRGTEETRRVYSEALLQVSPAARFEMMNELERVRRQIRKDAREIERNRLVQQSQPATI